MTTSTSQETHVVEIDNGPGLAELWDAGKYAFGNRLTVEFRGIYKRGSVTFGVRLKMQVLGVCHEDGSGTSFIITANILNHPDDEHFRGTKTFYYNARSRTGHLNLMR